MAPLALIATTRGWLSPGTHAPLIAQGGTGNDEFTVYSNQAELRLEGRAPEREGGTPSDVPLSWRIKSPGIADGP